MIAASSGTTTSSTAAPLLHRRVRDEIVHRDPAPGAQGRVSVCPAPPDEPGLRRTRVSGHRDDVLGYVAFLFATDTGVGPTALRIVEVEEDASAALTVVLVWPDA